MAIAQKGKTIFLHHYSYSVILIYLFFSVAGCIDTISSGQSLSPGQFLVSSGSRFELGFFSPGDSNNYYIGIWYRDIPISAVWVANRNWKISGYSFGNSSLVLSNGTLRLYDGLTRTLAWETTPSNATEAILLDNGNLVLVGKSGVVLWQSFDYPTDTWLPGARIGADKTVNHYTYLSSWRNSEDPMWGFYELAIDPNSPELIMTRNGTTYWTNEASNGFNFNPVSGIDGDNGRFFNYSYFKNAEGNYYTYPVIDPITIRIRVTINSFGLLQGLMWIPESQAWNIFMSAPSDRCGSHLMCGRFGVCNNESSPICSCLEGFVPESPNDWYLRDFSGGCVRGNPLLCNDRPSWLMLSNIYPPHSQPLLVLNVNDTSICREACSNNCSCSAYSIRSNGSVCLLWTEDLWGLQSSSRGYFLGLKQKYEGFDTESTNLLDNHNPSRKKVILRVAVSLPIALLLVTSGFLWLRRNKLKQTEARRKNQDLSLLNLDNNSKQNPSINEISGKEQKVLELPIFSFSSISDVTNKFSAANKLGEGGFGSVYKGDLLNGESVAVKRLAKLSGQGMEELRNEAILIAKLQHKNLVRLLGYCTEKDEKILIYEYMPNKSLDSFLFDSTRKELLNWSRRIRIINGIVQGLLYLHEYSRLRVVHRDLKASNILLDGDMNPKISDFGMARIFGVNDLHANTNRIVGTYGYMAPEYAMEGCFSVKSDIFAFGILLLEILSGKRNTGFRDSDFLSLLGYVWNLWENERVVELIDPVLEIPTSSSVVALRYIVVGLLCVQENPNDRPTISDVLFMLSNEQATLASPKKPGFIAERTLVFARVEAENGSVNYLTTSVMEAR